MVMFVLQSVSHLGETAVVLADHRRVRTVQLLDDLKALAELSEDVHHRAGEQSMLRRLLELWKRGQIANFKKTEQHSQSLSKKH